MGKAKFEEYYNIFPSMMGRHSYEGYVNQFIAYVDEIINDLNKCLSYVEKEIPPPPPPLKEELLKFLIDKKYSANYNNITSRVNSYNQDIDNIDHIIEDARSTLESSYPGKVIDDGYLEKFIRLFLFHKAGGSLVERSEDYKKRMRYYFDNDWSIHNGPPSSNKPTTYYFY